MKKFLLGLVLLFASYSLSAALEYEAQVSGMSCGSCAGKIKAELMKLEGIEKVRVILEDQKVITTASKTELEEAIQKGITDAGYEVKTVRALAMEKDNKTEELKG